MATFYQDSYHDSIGASQNVFLGVNTVLVVLMLLSLLARFHVRRNLLHALGWDDYTCILAAIGTVVQLSLNIASYWLQLEVSTVRGFSYRNAVAASDRLYYAIQIVYAISSYAVKLSFLLFYKRIFTVGKRLHSVINKGILLMALLYIAYLSLAITSTVEDVYRRKAGVGVTVLVLTRYIFLSQCIINLGTDIFVLVLPVRAVSRLQLKRRQKLGIIAVFSVGMVPCCMSASRFAFLATTQGLSPFMSNLLSFYFLPHIGTTEITVAVIAACCPTFPLFFTHVRQSTLYRRLVSRSPIASEKVPSSDDA